MNVIPPAIDLQNLSEALDYLESIEVFHNSRMGIKESDHSFDVMHYRLFRRWLREALKKELTE